MTSPDEKHRAPELAPCKACDRQHGSVGSHIDCLNNHIKFLLARLGQQRTRIIEMRDTFKSEGYNVDAMGFSDE